jgi:hypothetical protein
VKRPGMPARKTWMSRGDAQMTRTRLAPVSLKRQRENRERRAMVDKLWPDGQPDCMWPGCTRLADDVHEPLSRARGGSIVDPENATVLCRTHHDKVTFTPESELPAAVIEAGLLIHSWGREGSQ